MLKQLIENIIEYTKTWSITETEWYWNIECVRKPSNNKDKEITWKEFNRAIREGILYDLVYCGGSCLRNQMENDLCNYENDNIDFLNASKELEEQIQNYLNDFKLEREGEYEI